MANKTTEITEEDILKVATDLNYTTPTKEQIDYILENYEAKVEDDPTGFIGAWIEQLLDEAEVEQVKKNK